MRVTSWERLTLTSQLELLLDGLKFCLALKKNEGVTLQFLIKEMSKMYFNKIHLVTQTNSYLSSNSNT